MTLKKTVVLVLAMLIALGSRGAAALAGSPDTPVSDDPGMLEALAADTAAAVTSVRPYTGTGSRSLGALLLQGVDLTTPDPAAIAAMRPLGAGTESILRPDTRVRTYTTTFPARATVLITNSINNFRCSGFLIGPNTVATAGRCIHSGGPGGTWYSNAGYMVYPGADGASFPYGGCTVKGKYTVNGWTGSSNEMYDYGALKLNCTVGSTVGSYGFYWTSASLSFLPAIVSGYPGDRPSTQWWASDIVRLSYPEQIFYRNDTHEGMSGSPVWTDRPGVYAMAIHGYGLHGASPHSIYNHGKRFTSASFTNLMNWRNAP